MIFIIARTLANARLIAEMRGLGRREYTPLSRGDQCRGRAFTPEDSFIVDVVGMPESQRHHLLARIAPCGPPRLVFEALR